MSTFVSLVEAAYKPTSEWAETSYFFRHHLSGSEGAHQVMAILLDILRKFPQVKARGKPKRVSSYGSEDHTWRVTVAGPLNQLHDVIHALEDTTDGYRAGAYNTRGVTR